ncbi:MAG TPA: VCBS repeat-containing protein, partial [Candidatus Sulfotelmatobacter sp.]|nr:VCBS repeat-containing protein [Candidatus Sulfotelmatobacter sp.]
AYLTINPGPSCVLVDDFNGDGIADIAVGYEGGSAISVLVGQGDGTFAPKQDIPTWELPHFITSADINFDGKPDLIAAHYDWRRVSVMLNQSSKTGPLVFAPAVTHEVANDPVCLAVGDFNGDNLPDIVSANYASISVLLGQGDGTFATITNYFMGGSWAAVGDFNQDGMPDVAMDLGGKVGLFWNDTLPRLQIAPVPGGVRVSYPAWKFYTLEASSNVAQSSSWRLVTNTLALYGSQYVLTNTLEAFGQVYRLKRPSP